MANEYKTIRCKLDGKQSVSIPIDIKRNGRYVENPLDIIARGFLKFEDVVEESAEQLNTLEDKTVVYPVLFSSDRITINDGRCIITILPRSEDLFEKTSSVQTSASVSVSTSSIISQGGIREDEQIISPEKDPVVITIQPNTERRPYKLSIEITAVSSEDGSFYSSTVDRGTSPQRQGISGAQGLFQKERKRAPSNIIIECYNGSEWIPAVTSVLGANNSSYTSAKAAINDSQNSTPFGASTMYDAVISGARILSVDGVDDYKKTIYLFTDNESNMSISSLDNAIEEVNDIDGDKKVAVMISNMAAVDPPTLSIRANSSDTRNINKLAFLTGGQALTIVDENYLDDVGGIFYREAVGSMGYGTYEFVYDLGEASLLNNIFMIFNIPDNSNGTWAIETSLDGYNYTVVNNIYDYNESVSFENLMARYIKFKIVLITAISSIMSEYGEYPDSPSLDSIRIIYNAYNVSYLYLNKENVDIQPYQIALAVNANEINDGQIQIGVAKSDSHNWNDYSSDSQPAVNQNGKVVVPIRFSQDITQFQQEPLEKLDIFSLKTRYGSWDPFATVFLYDKLDDVIPTNYYRLLPRNGIVVFNYALPSDYENGDYKIGIINSAEYKVGLKLTNKTESEQLDIYGMGHMYTTGKDLLPPVAKVAPEAQVVQIINEAPNRFSIIEASYVYYDVNFEPEDTTKRTIKWFINGTPVDYLENLTMWNDITDPSDPIYTNTSLSYPSTLLAGETIETWIKKQSDSILSSGDRINFEIQVSDGELYSNKVQSSVVAVVESTPVLSQINVMAEDGDGNISSCLTTDRKAVIYPLLEDGFFSDTDVNQSEIVWYVNNEIFKRGTYGEDRGEGQPPIHEIWVNEVGTEGYVDYGLRIANSVFVQITPKTGDISGEAVTSPVVVVQNALPQVYNVDYVSTSYSENRDVVLAWDFFDFEIDAIGDIDETSQFDQTGVKWYRKNPGTGNEFELAYSYNDQDASLQEVFNVEAYRGNITTNLGTHTSTISSGIIFVGQEWYAIVTPHDSIDAGEAVTSATITITSAT